MNRVLALCVGSLLVLGLGEATGAAQDESASTTDEGPLAETEGSAEPAATRPQAEASDASRYEPQWLLTTGAGLHLNNFYAAIAGTIRYRNTYGRSSSRLFDNLYWEVGAGITTSIFVNLVRAHIEWSPIAILKLRATYRGRFTPGIPNSSGAGLPFARGDLPYGDGVLDARSNQVVAAYGHQLMIDPTLQAKVWRLIVLNNFSLGLHYFHGGPDYFYLSATDSLIRRGAVDLTVQEQPIVLFDIHQGPGFNKLYGGAYYQLNYAMGADLARHRVGLMALYSPLRKHGLLFEPTFILLFGLNLVDRNRQGTPYFMLVAKTGWDAFGQR